ncbi:RNA polymerase sigma factor [Nocardia sp. NRRL S-836]|uniref:RNA polymerase sigma factor n=1 Tax=Nocardia sp. NRRL S-836 TaxID=1519492 RepID=UPI0006AF7526|nr:RNA polymerase sigma factor [Nocardia sp. NRRL S-836]
MTDEELWGRVRAGDGDAFGLLFERHAQAVFAYCLRRTGGWAVAEDLVSVVFMETWRKRRSVTVDGSPSWSLLPWLYGVALGVTRNHHRSRSRYRAALDKVPLPDPAGDHADDVARRVDAETRTRAVIAELEKLPAADREVLEMSAWSDLTQAQIAQVLGIPVGTVKSRISRAQRTVRGALVEEAL